MAASAWAATSPGATVAPALSSGQAPAVKTRSGRSLVTAA